MEGIDNSEVARVVDDLYERSDRETFRIFHAIADLALEQMVEIRTEGLSQMPLGDIYLD